MPSRLAQHVAAHTEAPLFTEAETSWLRESFSCFSATLSPSSDWRFEDNHTVYQPWNVSAALKQDVPTGFDNDIPRSHTLRPRKAMTYWYAKATGKVLSRIPLCFRI